MATRTKDLATFLRDYERDHPEDVIHIGKRISSVYGCSAIARHVESLNKFPLILFENVTTALDEKSDFRCVVNVLGDRKKLAYAIGSDFERVGIDWRTKASESRIKPILVSGAQAPCKEKVFVGADADLLKFPILKHHGMDPGPYITAGMLTCYDPDTGVDNMAFHRGYVSGPREIRCLITPSTHNAINLRKHEQAGLTMKAAFWIGHHPAVLMGAQTRTGYPESHYEAAGGLAGEPLRLVPSETLGDDFLVPADAEIVIEGLIKPGHRDLEGPFGEYTRYFGPQQMGPVFEVTAVSHRAKAIWHSFMAGMNNHFGGTQEEGTIYAAVKKAVPQVQRVYCPVSGCGRFHAYIQIRKTGEGQAREAILAALTTSAMIKHVIVVDEDIDIYDDRWVLWAVATRSQWDKDLVVIPGCTGYPLDPTVDGGVTAKGGIDATKPAPPARFPQKLYVPEDVMKAIRLEQFVERDKLQAVPAAHDR